jgi:hypothetical protein
MTIKVICYWRGLDAKDHKWSYYTGYVPAKGDSVVLDLPAESNPKKKQCLSVFNRVWLKPGEVELHCERVD